MLLLMTMPLLLYGQQAVLSAGGDATGSGTSSYSVGQVVYTYKASGSSVSEGVQQAWEVTNLPVELLYFEAEVLDNREVELNWETLSEENNDYFTVERSKTGIDWEYVGKVSGAGTSTESLRYDLLDTNPYKGLSYYRLKQTDYDGSFSYSDTRKVRITTAPSLSLYPNPTKGSVMLEIAGVELSGTLSYRLLDMSGRELSKGHLSSSQTELNLSGFGTGIYWVELELEGGEQITKQVIKIKD